MKSLVRSTFSIVHLVGVLLISAAAVAAQSGDVSFPTPLTSNEIQGTIKARDIGDNRQTTYYFAFDGEQGDIFVNVVTKDLDGDIDIFAVDGMRSLTKMVVYSDSGQSETGRLIYLRKPERLLLNQGRPPGDTAATFRVKFAGSFVALKGGDDTVEAPVVGSTVTGGVRVNSVGTLIRTEKPAVETTPEVETETPIETPAETVAKKPAKPPVKRPPTTRVVVTSDLPPSDEVATPVVKKAPPPRRRRTVAKRPPVKKAEPEKEVAADPLENVRLVIEFKDGTRNDLRMPDILRFSVSRGELTVIRKNGTIERYSMVDVAKVTIE